LSLTPDELVRLLNDMPRGVQLFVPDRTAKDLFGAGDVDAAMNRIADDTGCHIGFQQSFSSTTNEKGYRFTK